MPEHQLETVMGRFIAGECDVLLSTSIVESGLDIPRANTIIIHRADRFGLAELYQLRGRVGRSRTQAHAYLLGPDGEWHGEVRERLMAIQAFTELGSGFRIAARDLEIRGAGSLLGHRQSGQIAAVGIDAYMALIREAMAQVRGEDLSPDFEPDIRLGIATAIPDDYVADGAVRLTLYKRIAGLADVESAEALVRELADRFGTPPPEVAPLVAQSVLRAVARRLRVTTIKHLKAGTYEVVFDAENTLSEAGLRLLLETWGTRLRFTSQHAFQVNLKQTPDSGGIVALTTLLAEV